MKFNKVELLMLFSAMLFGNVALAEPKLETTQKVPIAIEPAHSQFSFHAHVGPTLSTVTTHNNKGYYSYNSSDSSVKTRYRAMIGAGFSVAVAKDFSILSEINYVQKGATLEFKGNADSTLYLNFTYFEIPVLFNVTIVKDKSLQVFVQGGPQVGILSKAELSSREYKLDLDMSKNVNSLVLSSVLGAGVDIALSQQLSFRGGVRFSYDVTSAVSGSESSIRNSSFQGLAGLVVAL